MDNIDGIKLNKFKICLDIISKYVPDAIIDIKGSSFLIDAPKDTKLSAEDEQALASCGWALETDMYIKCKFFILDLGISNIKIVNDI